MALQRQLIDVPIVGGMDQKADPQLSVRPISLSNCCYRKTGAIEKRYGSELAISWTTDDFPAAQLLTPITPTLPPKPLLLSRFGDRLVRVGARLLHTCSSTSSAWTYCDHVPSVNVRREPVSMVGTQAWSGDVSTNGTLNCYVWCDATSRFGTGSLWAQVSNASSGEVVRAPYYIGEGRQVKTCYIDGNFIVTYVDASTFDIKGVAAPTSTLSFGTASTIISNGIKSGASSATAYALESVGDKYAIGYETNAPAMSIKVFTAAHANTSTTATGFALTVMTAIALKWDSSASRLWWAAVGPNGAARRIQYGALNSSFAVSVSNTTVDDCQSATPVGINQTYQNLGIEVASASECFIIYDTCVSATVGGIGMVVCSTTPSVGTKRYYNGALSLVSKPWIMDGRLFFAASLTPIYGNAHTTSSTPTENFIVFETPLNNVGSTTRPVGRYGPGIGHYATGYSHLSSAALSSSTSAWLALPFASDAGGTTQTRTTLWGCNVAFQTLPRRDAVELGGALYLTGGVLSVFDGATVAEVGFFSPPSIEVATNVAASGTLAAGTYTYVCVWEGIDSAGRVHKSAPSTPVSVTAALNDSITIKVRQLAATTKQDSRQSGAISSKWPFAVNLAVYRLQSGTYYRITGLPSSSAERNDYGVYMQTFTDTGTYTASTILAQPTLYTSGGTLPHVAPPGCTVIAAHQSRLFADSDDGTLWYSNPVAPGEIAAFTLDFRIPPFEGGPITALASLDSTLVIFKESSIYLLAGQGPNATGGGEQYGIPQLLSSDLGCINPRSIVTCPLGIFFQSFDGITLLSRSLQVSSDLGNRMELTLSGLPSIGSAVHMPDQNQVRFELYSSSDSARIVYDYHNDAWSLDSVYTADSIDGVSSPAFGAVMLDDIYTWVTEDGSLYRETLGAWLDSGNWIYMTCAFGNVRVGAVDGLMRLWRTALNVYRYSAAGAVFGSKYWNDVEVTNIWTAASSDRVQLQEHIASQLREYYTAGFVDTPPAVLGTGRGFSLTGITLEVGVRGSTSRRLAAGARK